MKDKFEAFQKYLSGITPVRQTIKAAIAEQEAWKKKYDKNTAADLIAQADRKIAELQEQARTQNQAAYEQMMKMSRELVATASEKANTPLDLTNTRLANTLQLANLGKLSYEQASGLAEQHRGNQNELRLVKSTFKEKGITSNIDALIYDRENMERTLSEYAYSVAINDHPPQGFMRSLGKFAKLEGIDDLPEAGSDDLNFYFRQGAGLPT